MNDNTENYLTIRIEGKDDQGKSGELYLEVPKDLPKETFIHSMSVAYGDIMRWIEESNNAYLANNGVLSNEQ